MTDLFVAEFEDETGTTRRLTRDEPDWGLKPTGWRVRIHGDAPFDVSMPFPVPLDDLADYVPAFNANGPVNAIPYVCAPGPPHHRGPSPPPSRRPPSWVSRTLLAVTAPRT